jgi:hypothetical protein
MLDDDVPDFPGAILRFRSFLAEQSHPTEIVWAFREDLYSPSGRFRVRFPLPPENESLAMRVYESGRMRGLVQIYALCRLPFAVVANIWFPATPEEVVQGWDRGLKLSINTPLTEAKPIHSSLAWRLRTFLPIYRLYQEHAGFVALRSSVAA